MMPWAEVLAFLQSLEARAEAGTTLQLVKTHGEVAGIVADVPAAPATAAKAAARAAAKAWRPRHVPCVPHTPSVTLGGRPHGRTSAP